MDHGTDREIENGYRMMIGVPRIVNVAKILNCDTVVKEETFWVDSNKVPEEYYYINVYTLSNGNEYWNIMPCTGAMLFPVPGTIKNMTTLTYAPAIGSTSEISIQVFMPHDWRKYNIDDIEAYAKSQPRIPEADIDTYVRTKRASA